MMHWLGVILCFGSCAAPLLAQGGCSQEAAQRAGARVRTLQAALLNVPQGEDEGGPEIPVAAQAQIPAFKDALSAAVDAGMRCVPAGAEPAAIEASLGKQIAPPGPDKPLKTTANTGDYGGNLSIGATYPEGAPLMRAVAISFGILCGSDTMLLLYEQQEAGWRQVLRWQAPQYTDISEAFGDFFDYVFLPGKDVGSWRIAVAHGRPLCTSRWSEFRIDVLAAGASAAAPRVVWHGDQSYFRDSPVRMTARPDGFEIRAQVNAIDGDVMERKGVLRYRVDGDTVERVAPIAADGRGFVDAWLQVPWSEAKRWSAPEGAAAFEKAHEAFAQGYKDAKVSYTYGPVRACTVKGRYEVEIDADPGGPQFYAIQEGQNGYTMVNFATTQDERCNGPDLMKRRR